MEPTSSDEVQMFGRGLVLEELRRHYDLLIASIDTLDQKLQSTVGFSSLIVTLVGLVSFGKDSSSLGEEPTLGLIILYCFLFFVTLYGLKPREVETPIGPEWSQLDKRFFVPAKDKGLEHLLSDYLQAIESASNLCSLKAEALKITNFLLFLLASLSLLTAYASS